MENHSLVLEDIRDYLRDIAVVLNEISGKLDKVDGAYSLDEVADAVLDIKLEVVSHLQSIDSSLSDISINTT